MNTTQILDAKYASIGLTESLTGAYWSQYDRDRLIDLAHKQLERIAAEFGFDLTPRANPLVEAIAVEAAQ